jgi:hypothetical protein
MRLVSGTQLASYPRPLAILSADLGDLHHDYAALRVPAADAIGRAPSPAVSVHPHETFVERYVAQ